MTMIDATLRERLVADLECAASHVASLQRQTSNASIMTELATLAGDIDEARRRIDGASDPYVEAGEAEYAASQTWGEAMGIDEGPAFYDPPADPDAFTPTGGV